MESFLRDLDVWCWKYLENTKNYPGLHLTARPESCDALLRALDVIQRAGPGAKRSIPLKPLARSDEAKITGGQRYFSFSTLRIVYSDETPELRRMCVSEDGALAVIAITATTIRWVRQGIEDVKRGEGDYSIGPPTHSRKEMHALGKKDLASLDLWFWPCFGHLWPV